MTIKFYGADWCPDCRRSKRLLEATGTPFDFFDIDQDERSRDYMVRLQSGGTTIPTIVFDDGSFLVEPTDAELSEKLNGQSS